MARRIFYHVIYESIVNLGGGFDLRLQKVEKRIGADKYNPSTYRFVNYEDGKMIPQRGQGLLGEFEHFTLAIEKLKAIEEDQAIQATPLFNNKKEYQDKFSREGEVIEDLPDLEEEITDEDF